MKCWKCGHEADLSGRLSFKATCDHCHAWLHCCVNCRFYKEGQPNACLIPGTETIGDREGANYCEEFAVRQDIEQGKADRTEVEKRLFGDIKTPKKTSFDSLFQDD